MTILKEFCEKNGKRLEVRLRGETENISIADVYVDEELVGSGSSEWRNAARRNAAKDAVHKLSQSMVVTDGSFEGIPAGNDRSFRIEAIQMLHVLCVKKRWPVPEYKEEDVLSPSYERKYAYSVKLVTSFGTVISMRGDEKSRKTYAMNSAAYKMFLAVQVSYNMINTTIQSYRVIYTKEADRMINTKEADRMINTKEANRMMINTKESDRMINTEEADCMINTEEADSEEADCIINTEKKLIPKKLIA